MAAPTYSRNRASRLATSSRRDFNFENFIYANEAKYPDMFNRKKFLSSYRELRELTIWNWALSYTLLINIAFHECTISNNYVYFLDLLTNVMYGFHALAEFYHYLHINKHETTCYMKIGLIVDLLSYTHYFVELTDYEHKVKTVCYTLRLHRPFRFLWGLNDENLKGNVLGTTLKYFFLYLVFRLAFFHAWINPGSMFGNDHSNTTVVQRSTDDDDDITFVALIIFYNIDLIFMPVGTSHSPRNDYQRIRYLITMLLGTLLVSGMSVAALSLVMSLYMRPEEEFRTRFRLIMKDMRINNVPPQLNHKVKTFYRMYWHKQRGVSETQLLPVFPPTLPATVFTEIYFEAHQKSPILRDLSYQFLWEVAKVMSTIHYIPGDVIIQRSTSKASIIYITYGDVEMLTAEDNRTPILRMTRGTILSPYGACASMACCQSLVEIRAATFCIAHVLRAADLWRVVNKYGRLNGQGYIAHCSFDEHLERVKMHYNQKTPVKVKYKSSILHLKRNLIALKKARDDNGVGLLSRNAYFLEIAGAYIMRNRVDSSLTEESDEICLRSTFPCILQPHSSLLAFWNVVMAILICIITITHPYNLVFKKEVSMQFRFFDYTMTVVFLIDLFVYLSTGANVEDGTPITFSQTSSQQVESFWFGMDVLGTLPIFEFIGEGHFAGLNKLLRLQKVFRVLKSMEEMCVYHSNVLRLMSYTLLVLAMCYLLATTQQAFMCFYHGYCIVEDFSEHPFWGEGPLDDESIGNQIKLALYWAVSLFTFTSQIMQGWSKDDTNTLLFNICLLEVVVFVHLFMGAVYSATIMVTTAMRDDYETCIDNVKNFLIRNQMEPTLRHRFITYLQLCWFTDKAYAITRKKTSIYFDLPPHVYQDLVAGQRSKYILCLPFMQLLHKEDLKNVSSHANLFYTSPNEILMNTGDVSNEIFIIKQGICEIFHPDTHESISLITEKEYFGVLECLMRFPAYYSVRAVTHVQVFSISRKHLQKLIEIPKIKDAIAYVKAQKEYAIVKRRREPFLSYEAPAQPPALERFPLPRKYIGDAAYIEPFWRLGFFSVVRYIFPRFTVRPDGRYLTRYEWVRAVCALASAFLFPGYTYLELQWPGLYYATMVLDITAYFDIIQRMLVAYFNNQGILVYHPASTAAHYIKGAFLVDLLACLPLERLEYPFKESDNPKTYLLMASAQFLMLNRLIQLYRLPGAMNILITYIERRDIILIIKSIPLFMSLINVLTSVIVFYSVDIHATHVGDTITWRIQPLPDEHTSWIVINNNVLNYNMTETPWNMHLSVFFWVVYETTTTGYGIFKPSSVQIMVLMFCGMVVGAIITTYITVCIISIRANVNKELANFQGHMTDIVEFMHREKLGPELRKEVVSHYAYNWEKTGGLDYRNVLKLCDQITLRTDAILHIYGHTFSKCPILYHCDVSLLRVLGRAVHNVYYLQDTRIIGKDDVISDIIFIDYGTVEIRDTDDEEETVVQLGKGSVFGNLDNAATFRSSTSVVTTSNVHLLQIKTQMFYNIIMDFPSVRVLMDQYRAYNENYIAGSFKEGSQIFATRKERSLSLGLTKVNRIRFLEFLGRNRRIVETYLIIISLACVFGDIYNAGFENNSFELIYTLYVLDFAFSLKIIVHFILPHLVSQTEMKQSLTKLRSKYINTEFKYDVISCLPLEALAFIAHDEETIWILFAMLRLNRIFRVATVEYCLSRHLKRLSINLVLSTIVVVSIWFSLFIHATTCAWYSIGVWGDRAEANTSWIHYKEYIEEEDGYTAVACENMYICSFYFVMSTFLERGVGEVIPVLPWEVAFVSVLQIVCFLMYMVYVGEFSNIIQYMSFRSFNYYSKYLELQEYMKNNRVSENLAWLIKKYSVHLWRESRGLQVPHFLATAPQCLRLNVMSATYMHHLTEHPVFKNCEPAFLRQLVGCLKYYTYCEDIFVVKEGEITDSMYLVHKGQVQELDEDLDVQTEEHFFFAGDHFGTIQGLVRGVPFEFSYRANTHAQVLTLHLDAWEYLLHHFPLSRYAIYKNFPGHPYGRPPPDDMGEEDQEWPVFPPPSPSPPPVASTSVKAFTDVESEPQAGPSTTDEQDADIWPALRKARWSADVVPKRSASIELELEPKPVPTMLSSTNLQNDTATSQNDAKEPGPPDNFRLEEQDTLFMEDETEEPRYHRRKSLLQKLASSAKKLVKKSNQDEQKDEEHKDALLIEEEITATTELIQKLENKDAAESVNKSEFMESLETEDTAKIDKEKISEKTEDKIKIKKRHPSKVSYDLKIAEEGETKIRDPALSQTPRRSILSTHVSKDSGKASTSKSVEIDLSHITDKDETLSSRLASTDLKIQELPDKDKATSSEIHVPQSSEAVAGPSGLGREDKRRDVDKDDIRETTLGHSTTTTVKGLEDTKPQSATTVSEGKEIDFKGQTLSTASIGWSESNLESEAEASSSKNLATLEQGEYGIEKKESTDDNADYHATAQEYAEEEKLKKQSVRYENEIAKKTSEPPISQSRVSSEDEMEKEPSEPPLRALQQRILADDKRPVAELTPEERNLMMMDSDLQSKPGEGATAAKPDYQSSSSSGSDTEGAPKKERSKKKK